MVYNMNETGIRLLSVLKLLLLLIALLIFYRNDIINLNVSAFGVFLGSGLGFGLSAVSLIASGLILRRRLFSQLMSVSKRNYLYGTILLVGSISLYVYGSYGSSDSGLFHYESFISFVRSYGFLHCALGTFLCRHRFDSFLLSVHEIFAQFDRDFFHDGRSLRFYLVRPRSESICS